MTTADLVLLVCGTVALVGVSRKPLRHPGSHGFYRFFAWEAMLLIGVLNRDAWGLVPETLHQLLAQTLLLASLLLVIAALHALKSGGGAGSEERRDGSLLEFEKTTRLVTSGIYRHIRHPMYASLLALNWGGFGLLPSWAGAALATVATFFIVLTARADEKECLRYFGPAYADYMKTTNRFVPYLY